jgi:cellulose synthase operon protein C
MGAAAAHDAPAHLLESPLDRVLEAAIEAFAAALLVEAEEPIAEAPSAALELRAQALKDALPAALEPASLPSPSVLGGVGQG